MNPNKIIFFHFKFILVLLFIVHSSLFIHYAFGQSPNTWTQKAAFPGTPRTSAVGFSIGTKGYVGTGQDSSQNLLSDFWEYDPSTNSWTQLADFAGSARRGAVGFAIGSKGYIGTGFDGSNNLLDFWEYDPSNNAWLQKRSLGGSLAANPRRDATCFVINNLGYVATGYDGTIKYSKECWSFDGDTTWAKKTDVGGGQLDNWRRWAIGFSIDTLGFIGCGFNYSQDWRKDFWRYNLSSNTWTQVANYGGTARSNTVGFSINGKGYVGNGNDTYYRGDFWQYDPAGNSWTQVADFGGGAVTGGIGFAVSGKGYAGLGYDSIGFRTDFWEYAPDSTIGINEPGDQHFDMSFFPNPCNDKLHVSANTKYSIQSIGIRTASGQILSCTYRVDKTGKVAEINTASLSPGVYFLMLFSEKDISIKKFLKH